MINTIIYFCDSCGFVHEAGEQLFVQHYILTNSSTKSEPSNIFDGIKIIKSKKDENVARPKLHRVEVQIRREDSVGHQKLSPGQTVRFV